MAVCGIDDFPDGDSLSRVEWIGGVGYNTSVAVADVLVSHGTRILKMSSAANVYTPPREVSGIAVPAGVLNYLNGEDLLSKTQALRLSTVDPDGWPKAALLSAGDVLAVSDRRLRLAIFANSGTATNLERDGRLTLSMALDGGMCSLRLRARICGQGMPELSLAFFEADIERVRMHVAAYADVTGGLTFALHDPPAVLDRWQRQIAALRAVSA